MVAGDFRKGVTIEIDGKVYMVVDFQHVKPGKGAAFVRTKLKNVVTGQVLEQTFNPTDKYPDARIERKEMQYSYNDGDLYYFMDMESFEMLPLNYDMVADAMQFVKEEMMVTIQLYKGEAFSVVPPNFVELEVASTEPGIQVYCGNFLDGSVKGKKGAVYGFRSAVCLETQKYPDTPNKPEWPSAVLRPGEKYESRCIYKFSVGE